MKITIYAKTWTNLTEKVSAYAYFLHCENGENFKYAKPFKIPVLTLTQVDCAAVINALAMLCSFQAINHAHHIELLTESSHVAEMIDNLKVFKHCDDIVAKYRDLQSKFPLLKQIKCTKIDKKMLPGDKNGWIRTWCEGAAKAKLEEIKNFYK